MYTLGSMPSIFKFCRRLVLAFACLIPFASAQARDLVDLPDLIATLLPSVVSIATVKIIEVPRAPDMPADPEITRRVRSLGSGFVIDPDGVIATNRHVIEGANEITVILQNGASYRASLIAAASIADVALLKISPAAKLAGLRFGNSDRVRVGDPVLAIGNPLGLGGSVTRGIVSALNRDIRETPFDDFIQTDAAINHGNSGGPLFNESGEVIGINTAIFGAPEDVNSGSIGLAFAMPSNDAKFVIDRLRQYGRVRAGWIGVRMQHITPALADSLGLQRPDGALVSSVDPGGPAETAGIQEGDVIEQFDGRAVPDIRNLWRGIGVTAAGQSVPVMLSRDGSEMTLQVTVAEEPEPMVPTAAAKLANAVAQTKTFDLGLTLEPVDDTLRARFQLPADISGLVVTSISPDGAAADLGLSPGDVVTKVQRSAVTSRADFLRALEAARQQKHRFVLLQIHSTKGDRFEALPLEP